MDFRQASPRKAARKITKRSSDAGTGKDRLVPLAQLKKSTAKSTPLSRKRSAQQIAQEEQAFDDSAWPSDDDYEPIEDPDRGRSARSDLDQSTGSATKKLKTSAATKKLTAEQATAQCLEALRKLRDKVHPFERVIMPSLATRTSMLTLQPVHQGRHSRPPRRCPAACGSHAAT